VALLAGLVRAVAVVVAGDLMWLAFALSRRWPPYAKWRGAAFQALAVAADLADSLAAAATAPGWRGRESGLADACQVLLSAQRARGLTGIVMVSPMVIQQVALAVSSLDA
jgi:hypothetical protein